MAKRKLLILALSVTLICGMAACGQDKPAQVSEAVETSTTEDSIEEPAEHTTEQSTEQSIEKVEENSEVDMEEHHLDGEVLEYVNYEIVYCDNGAEIIYTNNYDEDIILMNEAYATNENGDYLDDLTHDIPYFDAGSTVIKCLPVRDDEFSEITMVLSVMGRGTKNVTSEISVEDSIEDSSKVVIKVTNQSNEEIEYLDANIVFYKDGQLVGVESAYGKNLEAGGDLILEENIPTDSKGKTIIFDEYEVYVYAYDI